MRILLSRGCDTDAQGTNGETALHLAASHGHVRIVDILLDYGARVDVGDEYGDACISHAARKGKEAVIRVLRLSGACTRAQNRFGDTPVDQATCSAVRTALEIPMKSVPRLSWYWLPVELAERVFAFLDPRSLGRCALVCSRWQRCTDSDAVWEKAGVSKAERMRRSVEGSISSANFFAAPFLAGYRPSRNKKPIKVKTGPSKFVDDRSED